MYSIFLLRACALLKGSTDVVLKRLCQTIAQLDPSVLKPEVVLGPPNRKSCITKFKVRGDMVLTNTASKKKEFNEAAVLVPICFYQGELGLLYTLRSSKLNVSRGQVSFPGGMKDKKDRDAQDTALRETWEELSIERDRVDVWCTGNQIFARNVLVTPVLAYVGQVEPEKLRINSSEVAEAFVVSLATLCQPSNCHFTQFRNSYSLPTYLTDKHRIWGLTAMITHIVLSALLPTAYKHKIVYLKSVNAPEYTVQPREGKR